MEEEQREKYSSEDPFSRMMFGSKSEDTEDEIHDPSSLDFEELMLNIDALVESAKNLKPLVNKVFPIIEQLWKKGKDVI